MHAAAGRLQLFCNHLSSWARARFDPVGLKDRSTLPATRRSTANSSGADVRSLRRIPVVYYIRNAFTLLATVARRSSPPNLSTEFLFIHKCVKENARRIIRPMYRDAFISGAPICTRVRTRSANLCRACHKRLNVRGEKTIVRSRAIGYAKAEWTRCRLVQIRGDSGDSKFGTR